MQSRGSAPETARPASRLVVAVLTFRRPDDLPDLLPLLVAEGASAPTDVSVLVVDNDAEASARQVVTDLGLPEVRYVVEPTPGIAAARNRALAECAEADLLVFIDDDERPEPQWLARMVRCHAEHSCAAVAGAVVPDAVRIEDPWIEAGGFFVRQRHRTGTELPAASTANLLLDLREVRRLGLLFDESLGLSGGSDTRFTRELVARGGRIVWCDEAVVVDHIRSARLTRRWVLQRHFRAGNGWSRISLELAGSPVRRLVVRFRQTAAGMARVLAGTARTTLGLLVRSLRHQARGSRTTARGVGMISGAWGVRYGEYTRPPADAGGSEVGSGQA